MRYILKRLYAVKLYSSYSVSDEITTRTELFAESAETALNKPVTFEPCRWQHNDWKLNLFACFLKINHKLRPVIDLNCGVLIGSYFQKLLLKTFDSARSEVRINLCLNSLTRKF